MGCGPAQPEAPDARPGTSFTVHGDYFSADTRALLAICEMADVPVTFQVVDTLEKANMQQEYLRINPTGHIPMLSAGLSRVVAPGYVIFEWILKTNEKAKAMFHHTEQEAEINALQRYFFREMRGCTSQLIARLALKVLDPEKAPKSDNPKVLEKLKLRFVEFEKQRLTKLNEQLGQANHRYLTGDKQSVVDIILYCEIFEVLTLYGRTVPMHLEHLNRWYDEIGSIQQVKDYNAKLIEVIDRLKLKEPHTEVYQ